MSCKSICYQTKLVQTKLHILPGNKHCLTHSPTSWRTPWTHRCCWSQYRFLQMPRNLSLFPGRSNIHCPARFLSWLFALLVFSASSNILPRTHPGGRRKWPERAHNTWTSPATATSSYFRCSVICDSRISVWFLFTGYIISITPLSGRCGWARLAGITNWFGSANQRRKQCGWLRRWIYCLKIILILTQMPTITVWSWNQIREAFKKNNVWFCAKHGGGGTPWD